jgi:hypothetical protein
LAYLLPRSEADEVLRMKERERQDLQQIIRQRNLVEPAGLTEHRVYDVHNNITHAAHGRPFVVRRSLQELGGELLSRARNWPPAPSLN